ncbi:MAG: 2-(R)-hydroxypropyl-CoM dehydrogenase [Candidatus Heimdallarchaeota archaeon LC_2]|nr:MAG: 2-(R)-hydroxypropyl-CoM dehydrogenase [Candidatus Heimdallarchaeota archaeon LC_2]
MNQQNNLFKTQIKLENARILITGGTSGLGKGLALALSKIGAKVAIIARRKELLDEIKILHPKIITIQGDISNKNDTYKLSANVFGHLGEIDILINNASYLGPTPLQLLLDTECEDLTEVLETNLMGPFRLTKSILPSMILQKSGLVINISSDAAISAYETWGSYSISKAALDHLSKIWNEELKGTGVRMISLDPGDMATPMHFSAIPEANPNDLFDPNNVARDLLKFIEKLLKNSINEQVRFSAKEWRMEYGIN